MSVDRNLTPAEESLSVLFEKSFAGEPLRASAIEAFRHRGLPTKRVEDWKWTDLRGTLREALEPAPANDDDAPARTLFADLAGPEILIENGRARLAGSYVGSGFSVVANGGDVDAPGRDGAVALLNRAQATDGVTIRIDRGAKLEQPIVVRRRASTDGAVHVRSKVRVGAGAEATIIEIDEVETGGAFINLYTDVEIEAGATLRRYVAERLDEGAVLADILAADIDARGVFEQAVLTAGARLVRRETHIDLAGAGAACRLASAVLAGQKQHADLTSVVRHIAPGCETRQQHRAVLADAARGVFQGKIKVERDAQKTDGRMAAHALLLSDTAEANAKPELEIYADDVECAHGATVGALDADALFYMRSRGLSEREAQALLIDAFLAEAFEMITDEDVRAGFERLAASLREGGGA
ncbi:MAG: Fe-S cluster assembly protein SufD [Pseudomonadota bacterium]